MGELVRMRTRCEWTVGGRRCPEYASVTWSRHGHPFRVCTEHDLAISAMSCGFEERVEEDAW